MSDRGRGNSPDPDVCTNASILLRAECLQIQGKPMSHAGLTLAGKELFGIS